MSLTVEARNKMLDHLVGTTQLYVAALHSEDVSDEILTGRKQIMFTTAEGGVVVGNSLEDLIISIGFTVTHIALYDTATEGVLLGVFSLTNPETFANEGSLTIQNLTITLN